jgi:hypothetical protein
VACSRVNFTFTSIRKKDRGGVLPTSERIRTEDFKTNQHDSWEKGNQYMSSEFSGLKKAYKPHHNYSLYR